jgi:hypothetical protein
VRQAIAQAGGHTGYGWMAQVLVRDHARLSYALDGCRDNAEMESFHTRFKTENRSLFLDARTLADLQASRRLGVQRSNVSRPRRVRNPRVRPAGLAAPRPRVTPPRTSASAVPT